jgi:hypothetical protein
MPSSNSKKKYGAGWGQSNFVDLEMPSGALAQVRKANPRQLLMLGYLDKFNELKAMVQTEHVERVKGKPTAAQAAKVAQDAMKAVGEDPAKMREVMEMADRITEYMVVQPKVKRPVKIVGRDEKGKPIEEPLDDDERESGIVYTDDIDSMDRMFLMQYAVGVKTDLKSFRQELDEFDRVMGDVQSMASETE